MVNYCVAAVSVGLLLTAAGCNKQATGQAVAVVNGEEVTSAELNAELAAVNLRGSPQPKQVMPQLLQRVIDRKLLAQQAIDQGIDKTPEYLTRQRRLHEELLIGLAMKKQAEAMKTPNPQEIDAFIAANPQMFGQRSKLSLDQLVFQRPADLTVVKGLEDDHSLAEIADTLTALGIPFRRNRSELDSATTPPEFMRQVDALPAGEPFLVPQGPALVASVVTAREPIAVASERHRRIAGEALRDRKLREAFEKQLKDLRTKTKVEYQPGYAPPKDKALRP